MSQQTTAHLMVPVGPADHSAGADTAPVTLVEYGDYECPDCGDAYRIINDLQHHLGPRLRFVFRSFPITTTHPHSERAAEAAEAAATQDQFWPMHDMLYENQGSLEDDDLFQYADAIGLDEFRFATEVLMHVHTIRVREDFTGGVHSGVNGTPTFFINGTRHDGLYDFTTLLHAVEASLSRGWA
jgi:protein-disulfide isomerase